MQTIRTTSKIHYNFVYDMFKLYEYYSEINKKDINVCEVFKPIVDLINSNLSVKVNGISYSNKTKETVDLAEDNRILVAFSGGKDSLTTALKLLEQGYNVILYYVEGINKSFPTEKETSIKLAQKLNVPIIIDRVIISGKNWFMESPVKNQVIYSLMLNYGLNKGIKNYAFGNYKLDNVNSDSSIVDRNFSDRFEMFELFTEAISNLIGEKINNICVCETHIETYKYLVEKGEIFDMLQSCLMPARYHKNIRKLNMSKYGINLSETRCGSCKKCCEEYVSLVDLGLVDYNKNYYIHCLEILVNNMKRDKKVKNVSKKQAYMYYIENEDLYNKSKLRGNYIEDN